ncbi:hypothetical protein PM082_023959 [Marasmius tenuissimus]|nr:hypothetical protein PM082_023959 [Marasmius tenuissimus]
MITTTTIDGEPLDNSQLNDIAFKAVDISICLTSTQRANEAPSELARVQFERPCSADVRQQLTLAHALSVQTSRFNFQDEQILMSSPKTQHVCKKIKVTEDYLRFWASSPLEHEHAH